MRVSFDGGLFRASHISGPTHNYLGLKLAEGAAHPGSPSRCIPLLASVAETITFRPST